MADEQLAHYFFTWQLLHDAARHIQHFEVQQAEEGVIEPVVRLVAHQLQAQQLLHHLRAHHGNFSIRGRKPLLHLDMLSRDSNRQSRKISGATHSR